MATAPVDDELDLHLFCHGLGDCHLIGIPKSGAGGGTFWMLIDCGIHNAAANGGNRIRDVVTDVMAITGGHIDVIVGTHEHWDHLSGFTQAADLFAGKEVGEVWFSWAENPADPLSRQLDKFKGDALAALADSALRLAGDPAQSPLTEGIDSMLGFVFGAAGEATRGARNALQGLSKRVRYLEPGTLAELPPEAQAVRVYVLGPPRDVALLGIEDSVSGTYHLGAGGPAANALRNGLAIGAGGLDIVADPLAPFDRCDGRGLSAVFEGTPDLGDPDIAFLSRYYAGPPEPVAGIDAEYAPGPDQGWRRIDNDWLGLSADLALQLDSRTNNSSLVLAIEIAATGRVLLFAADAQIGNWKSWAAVTFPAAVGETTVTGADLLKRTVFYKVGHHGSRNATLSANGLELMVSSDLSAFIPTDQAMALKVKWKDIPANGLLGRLHERTSGRVIQSDSEWVQKEGVAPLVTKSGSLRSIVVQPGKRVDLKVG